MSRMMHTPPLDVPLGFKSRARWSAQPEGKLLIFVHGFMGNATDTWAGLPERLCIHPELSGCDIICYGYESAEYPAGQSANALHADLKKVISDAANTANRSIEQYDPAPKWRRSISFGYTEVILIAHSLGACVVRRAILNQIISGEGAWPGKIKLVWFAPAHCGARVFRLVTVALFGIPLLGIDGLATFTWPVLKDLEEESAFLKQLLKDTDAQHTTHPHVCSPLTLWAKGDKVVINGIFSKDKTPYEEIKGVNHVEICKPDRTDRSVRLLLSEVCQ